MKYDFTESFKSFRLVNLTPHAINFILPYHIEVGQDEMGNPHYVAKERTYSLAPSGTVARCKVERKEVDSIFATDIDGWDITIPITSAKFGEVEGLPEPEDGTVYIVSNLVAQAVPHRDDVFFPDDVVRDENGNIIGCRALGKI